MRRRILFAVLALAAAPLTAAPVGTGTVMPEPAHRADMTFVGQQFGSRAYRSALKGAQAARSELDNAGELREAEPRSGAEDQIGILESAIAEGAQAVMLANTSGDRIVPAAVAARSAGAAVVTWGAPIPSGEGEALFVGHADPAEVGAALAEMAQSILGGEGEFAILAGPADAQGQQAWIAAMKAALEAAGASGLKLVDTVRAAGNTRETGERARILADKYPDLELIVAPDPDLLAAAARALAEAGLCERVKVSGLGIPAEMAPYVRKGCAPEFAYLSFEDLGYLTYHAAYLLATGQLRGEVGESFEAGRLGAFTVEADPARKGARRVLLDKLSLFSRARDPIAPR